MNRNRGSARLLAVDLVPDDEDLIHDLISFVSRAVTYDGVLASVLPFGPELSEVVSARAGIVQGAVLVLALVGGTIINRGVAGGQLRLDLMAEIIAFCSSNFYFNASLRLSQMALASRMWRSAFPSLRCPCLQL